MGISQIITLIVAILLIGFILWWFFGKHQEAVGTATVDQGTQEANIVADFNNDDAGAARNLRRFAAKACRQIDDRNDAAAQVDDAADEGRHHRNGR